MNEIMNKLIELEQERECIERCQKKLREEMLTLDSDYYLKKKTIYYKNKEELKDVNKKIEILNDALDILNEIGV